jgi:TolA-binding protein
LLIALSFPAAALAAAGGRQATSHPANPAIGPRRPAAGPAAAVAALQRPVDHFDRLVGRLSRQIQAEEEAAVRERRREELERFEDLPGGVSLATLESIASCESGGDPAAVSADGSYRGKYQFDVGTWEAVGGSGDPAAAPEAEQDYRAALLLSRSGSSPWPVCG